MRKLFLILMCVLAISGIANAADQKLTALTEDTSPASTDVLYFVKDPGGSPLSRKVTIANFITNMRGITADSLSNANLTALTGASTWKVFYTDGSGTIQEVALGDTGSYLRSSGTMSAPAFVAPTIGTGNVSASSVITDHYLVRGDGGVYNVQYGNCILDDGGWLTCTGGITAPSITLTGTGQAYLNYGFQINQSKGSTSSSDFQLYGSAVAPIMNVTASSNSVTTTGSWSFTSASSLRVPINANVTSAGSITVDNTDDQFHYYGSAKRVLSYKKTKCATIENLADTDDNFPIGSDSNIVTATKVWCTCIGTCTTKATFSLSDSAGNAFTMATPTCGTSASIAVAATITSSTVTQANEETLFSVTNTPSPTTDEYSLCREEIVNEQ